MPMMKKGNVYRIATGNKAVRKWTELGFVIVQEDGGGAVMSPSTTVHDEAHQRSTAQPVLVVEVADNPLMMNGLYGDQMNRTQLMAWMDREGLPYDKRGKKDDFIEIYKKYKKTLKAR